MVTGESKKVLGQAVMERKTIRTYGTASSIEVMGDGDVTDLKIDVVEAAAVGKEN